MSSTSVSWKTTAPIIGDVVVSPWNLLIGGLLITKLDFKTSIISIFVGYSILSLIFYYYGSLGLTYKKKTSELIEPIFGRTGTKYFFSVILAAGQIGWFALISEIGGRSLAHLMGLPGFVGIVAFALLMFVMARLTLYKMGVVKLLITLSSLSLITFLIVTNYSTINFAELINTTGNETNMLWGVSVVVSSLISFATITPDFYSEVRNKRDAFLTTVIGLFLPGLVVTILGCALFFGKSELSFELLIGAGGLAVFGHIFNVITNTDASIALYTPGHRITYTTKLPFNVSLVIAATVGTILALTGMVERLDTWLALLAGFYPSIIALTIFYYVSGAKNSGKKQGLVAIASVLAAALLVLIAEQSLLIWVVSATAVTLYFVGTNFATKMSGRSTK